MCDEGGVRCPGHDEVLRHGDEGMLHPIGCKGVIMGRLFFRAVNNGLVYLYGQSNLWMFIERPTVNGAHRASHTYFYGQFGGRSAPLWRGSIPKGAVCPLRDNSKMVP